MNGRLVDGKELSSADDEKALSSDITTQLISVSVGGILDENKYAAAVAY